MKRSLSCSVHWPLILAIDEESLGHNHPKVAIRLNNLAQLFYANNQMKAAEPLMQRALAIDEQSYGANHPSVARDLNNLAQLFQDTNRLGEAEPLIRRHLGIFLDFTRRTGHPHPHLNTAIDNYGGLLMEMGLSQEQTVAKLKEFSREHGIEFGGE